MATRCSFAARRRRTCGVTALAAALTLFSAHASGQSRVEALARGGVIWHNGQQVSLGASVIFSLNQTLGIEPNVQTMGSARDHSNSHMASRHTLVGVGLVATGPPAARVRAAAGGGLGALFYDWQASGSGTFAYTRRGKGTVAALQAHVGLVMDLTSRLLAHIDAAGVVGLGRLRRTQQEPSGVHELTTGKGALLLGGIRFGLGYRF